MGQQKVLKILRRNKKKFLTAEEIAKLDGSISAGSIRKTLRKLYKDGEVRLKIINPVYQCNGRREAYAWGIGDIRTHRSHTHSRNLQKEEEMKNVSN